jgi:competence protein ComEC
MEHRPLLFIVLAFSAGIFLDSFIPVPILLLLGLTLGALVCSWATLFFRSSGFLYMVCCLVLAFLVGGAYHHVRFYYCPKGHIVHLVGEEKRLMRLRGVVMDMPATMELPPSPLPWMDAVGAKRRTRFLLKVEEAEGIRGWYKVGGVVLVNIYDLYEDRHNRFRYGQVVEVLGEVSVPRGQRNPGEFDYCRYLQRQWPSVRAVMSVEDDRNVKVIREDGGNIFFRRVYGLKEGLIRGIHLTAFGDSAPIMGGLVLGTRENIPWPVIEDFKKTGTYHFLAISGLQVGMLVATIYALFYFLRVPRRLTAPLLIFITALYALLTGLEPAVLRTALMVISCLGALLVKRRWDLPSGIATAVMVMLLWNPSDLFSVGFQLSILGVLGLIYLGPRVESLFWGSSLLMERLQVREEMTKMRVAWVYLRKSLCFSFGAWLATVPLVLYYFHILCPLGAPVSVLVFPLVWVITVGGFILMLIGQIWPPLGLPLAYIVHVCDFALKGLISLVASVPLCSFYSPSPSWPWLFGFYGLGLLSLIREGLGLRLVYFAGLCLILGNAYLYSGMLFKGDKGLGVTGLDVGHGSCTFIQFPNGRKILYDAGSGGGGDAGRNIVAPFLWHQGVRRLDAVVISHEDEDHFNALPSLLERFQIDKVLVSQQFSLTDSGKKLLGFLKAKGVEVGFICKGSKLGGLGEVSLKVLNPPPGLTGLSSNDASCVLRVYHTGKAVLLCGDLQEKGIEMLLASGGDLKADILQAPHHGGNIDNVGELIKAVGPVYVFISTGIPRDPAPFGKGRVLQTYQVGAVTFTLGSGDISVKSYRNLTHGRYSR